MAMEYPSLVSRLVDRHLLQINKEEKYSKTLIAWLGVSYN